MPLDRVPASPFIALKGRARVIACGKGKKMRKRKRKTKKAWGVLRLPPYLVRVADPVA
jgi:hypothetical protein